MSLAMLLRTRMHVAAALAGLVSLATVASAWATVPQTVVIEGLLYSAGGGAAADGNYKLTFAIYKDATGGAPVWSETVAAIAVKGGGFSYQLGSATPLSPATLAGLPSVFLGIAVESDPEMTRKPMSSVPFSLRAGLAEGLDCTGCVTLNQLDPKVLQAYAKSADLAKVATSGAYADLAGKPTLAAVATSGAYKDLTGSPDLTGFAALSALAKVATTGNYTDLQGAPDLTAYAKTAALAKVATSGKYGDVTGGPALGTSCGTGLVLRGFKADGSYDCIATLDPNALPVDSLVKVSNGLLTDQIADVVASVTVPGKIPDNNPVGVSDTITWPDYGLAQAVTVTVDISNSDTSTLKVILSAPDNSQYVLFDKGAKATSLKASWTDKSVLISGTLADWVGKNPKGKWSITVIDLGFLNNATDGQINSWSFQAQTLSTKKVQALGGFQFYNAAAHPVTCEPSQAGFSYYNTKDKALYICNGTDFFAVYTVAYGSQQNPATSCKDILNKSPISKDGVYWLNPDASTAFATWCDMTTDGGGWTLAMRFKNDAKFIYSSSFWTDKNLLNEDAATSVDPTLNSNAKLQAFVNVPGTTVRGCKGASGACFQQSLGGTKTLQVVFNEGFKGGGPDRGTVNALWGNDGGQPNCNGSGLNNASATYGGYGTYSAARFGLVGNNEGDCGTTDSAWGFGVYGSSNTASGCGCGLAGWSVSNNCTQGTLWVR
jgi:subtilisin-like proprotein convertase family protein